MNDEIIKNLAQSYANANVRIDQLEREITELHQQLANLREDNWELLNLAQAWEFAWGDNLTPQSLAILKEVTARTALRENARIERIKARKA
jgi:hypothetical protein